MSAWEQDYEGGWWGAGNYRFNLYCAWSDGGGTNYWQAQTTGPHRVTSRSELERLRNRFSKDARCSDAFGSMGHGEVETVYVGPSN